MGRVLLSTIQHQTATIRDQNKRIQELELANNALQRDNSALRTSNGDLSHQLARSRSQVDVVLAGLQASKAAMALNRQFVRTLLGRLTVEMDCRGDSNADQEQLPSR